MFIVKKSCEVMRMQVSLWYITNIIFNLSHKIMIMKVQRTHVQHLPQTLICSVLLSQHIHVIASYANSRAENIHVSHSVLIHMHFIVQRAHVQCSFLCITYPSLFIFLFFKCSSPALCASSSFIAQRAYVLCLLLTRMCQRTYALTFFTSVVHTELMSKYSALNLFCSQQTHVKVHQPISIYLLFIISFLSIQHLKPSSLYYKI